MPIVIVGYGVHLFAGRFLLSTAGAGRISPQDVTILWQLLAILGVALIVNTAGNMFVMMLYARGATRRIRTTLWRGFALGSVAKALLLIPFGVYGVALGHLILKAHNAASHVVAVGAGRGTARDQAPTTSA